MQEILTIAQSISPIGIIAILVIIIYQLIDGKGLLSKIRGTQEEKYPALQKAQEEIVRHLEELDFVYAEQRKFRENHSMHEIPDIVNGMSRMESKLDKLVEMQYAQGLDIARLKAFNEK